MSKQRTKKKRTEAYTGADAANTRPTVHRYTAVKHGPLKEWWQEKRGPYKLIGGIVATLAFLSWLIFEAIRAIS